MKASKHEPLQGLASVPWDSLKDAYGSAATIPKLLHDLAGPDSELRSNALEAVAERLWHQGSIYSATAAAVPFLMRLALNTPDRVEALELVAAIAASAASYSEGEAEAQCLQALRKEVGPLEFILLNSDGAAARGNEKTTQFAALTLAALGSSTTALVEIARGLEGDARRVMLYAIATAVDGLDPGLLAAIDDQGDTLQAAIVAHATASCSGMVSKWPAPLWEELEALVGDELAEFVRQPGEVVRLDHPSATPLAAANPALVPHVPDALIATLTAAGQTRLRWLGRWTTRRWPATTRSGLKAAGSVVIQFQLERPLAAAIGEKRTLQHQHYSAPQVAATLAAQHHVTPSEAQAAVDAWAHGFARRLARLNAGSEFSDAVGSYRMEDKRGRSLLRFVPAPALKQALATSDSP